MLTQTQEVKTSKRLDILEEDYLHDFDGQSEANLNNEVVISIVTACSEPHLQFGKECGNSVRALKRLSPFQVEWLVGVDPNVDPDDKQLIDADKVLVANQPAGLGPSRLRNMAFGSRSPESQYCFSLNIDDMIIPEGIIAAEQYLDENPEVGLVGINLYQLHEGGELVRPNWLNCVDNLFDVREYIDIFKKEGFNADSVSPIHPNTSLFRCQTLEEVNGWYTGLKIYEDVDLLIRINRLYPVATIKEIGLLYRHHLETATGLNKDWSAGKNALRSLIIGLDDEYLATELIPPKKDGRP